MPARVGASRHGSSGVVERGNAPRFNEASTYGDALRWATARLEESPTARLDAELLLAHAAGLRRAELLAMARDPLPDSVIAALDVAVRRRAAGEPVAYITGVAYFHSLRLAVTPDVLVPRPETEMLVEWALGRIRDRRRDLRVLDVGTGSGAIVLAIAASGACAEALDAGACELHATDTSAEALAVARSNARRLGLADRVAWHRADLLPGGSGSFDLVVANLPYVAESEMGEVQPGVLAYEPRGALLAGTDGLDQIRRLLRVLPARLARDGAVALEIGWRQGPAVACLARESFPSATVTVRQDFAGHDRMAMIELLDDREP
ncbi:MAG: peptide chain release factor N(5)-glutamine methyltransferase [Anaerolineae bacterium]|jgi:release factor glutamine methyltransferase